MGLVCPEFLNVWYTDILCPKHLRRLKVSENALLHNVHKRHAATKPPEIIIICHIRVLCSQMFPLQSSAIQRSRTMNSEPFLEQWIQRSLLQINPSDLHYHQQNKGQYPDLFSSPSWECDICKGPISFYERGILLISCMEISSQVFMLLLCFFSEVSCFVYSAPVIMQGC